MHVAMCKDSVSVARPIERSFATATASPASAAANTTVIATTFLQLQLFFILATFPTFTTTIVNVTLQLLLLPLLHIDSIKLS